MMQPTTTTPAFYPAYPNRPQTSGIMNNGQPQNYWPQKPVTPQVDYLYTAYKPQETKDYYTPTTPQKPSASPPVNTSLNAGSLGKSIEKKTIEKTLPSFKLGMVLGVVTMLAPFVCLLFDKYSHHWDRHWEEDWHHEPAPNPTPTRYLAEPHERISTTTQHWRHRDRTAWDGDLALFLQAQEQLRAGHGIENSRSSVSMSLPSNAPHRSIRHPRERHHSSSVQPLQEGRLPQATRRKLDDLRSLLSSQSDELVDIFVNNRRGRSGDTEFCFSFDDPDKFPEALKSEYEMGQIDFFLPARSIPPSALSSKEGLKSWLNLPALPHSAPLRVQ